MQEMGTTADQSWGVDDSLYAVREMNLCGMRTVGIYDRDESATFDDLQKTATVATRSLDQLDVTAFFEPKPEN
jgi:FMN phosphatase YigB (HAD superfamily)